MELYYFPTHAIMTLMMFFLNLVKEIYYTVNKKIKQFYEESIEHKEMRHWKMEELSKNKFLSYIFL